ncbi:MAG: aspartyl/asparaginyl beta-hydroxylase domain-containing protein [Janthinobacterium lividum]
MFHDPSSFAVVQAFQQNWQAIRQEYLGLQAPFLDLHRNFGYDEYFARIKSENGWLASWQLTSTEKNLSWDTYLLSLKGQFPDDATEKYPTVQALIRKYPQVGTCLFSRMSPLYIIPPHDHADLGGDILTCHLGIDLLAGHSYLNVEGVFEEEREGRALVFDGSTTHSAINMSARERVVLYMEFDQSR